MTKFLNYMKYEFKIFLGNFSSVFWMMVYPIILLTVFTLAFSKIRNENIQLEKVNIGYSQEASMPLKIIGMNTTENFELNQTDNDDAIESDFFVGKKMDETQGAESLNNNSIEVFVDKDLNLLVKETGINQSLIQGMVSTYKQIEKLNLPLESYNFDNNLIKIEPSKSSSIDVVFYALFGMVSLYGSYLSVEIGNKLIFRNRHVAIRNSISPTPKSFQIIVNIVSSLSWTSIMIMLTILYSTFALKQDFFTLNVYNIPILFSAIILGISIGLIVGILNDNPSTQVAIMTGINLFLSALSGIFGDSIRTSVLKAFPLIEKINPLNIISNELIRINQLNFTSSVLKSSIIVMGFSFTLVLISMLLVRRNKQ